MNDPSPAWHALDPDAAARLLDVDPARGLATDQAERLLARVGENRLLERPARKPWVTFAEQFSSVLVLVLVAAAVLAGIVGDTLDAAVILAVVVFNAVLGFVQQYRAEAAIAALKKMLTPKASVRRDGRVMQIPAWQLVSGDIVLLEAGDRIPADGRWLAVHDVEVDESALTGESHPVGKQAHARLPAATEVAERITMAYMNTTVTRGRGEIVVTATGTATEMGRLSALLATARPDRTPLEVQLDALGRRLAGVAAVVIALIFALGLARGNDWLVTLLTSIALAVAAIPEGLPAVVTVTLALGAHRLAREHAIVKKLAAVETLGCTTVICSDKTGTLTMNQMTVRAIVAAGRRLVVDGQGYEARGEVRAEDGGGLPDLTRLARAAVLANDSRLENGRAIGDPTEAALLTLAGKLGVAYEDTRAHYPRLAEIPFDARHKFQATFHHDGAWVYVAVKGAPEVLLPLCSHEADDEDRPLDAAGRHRWQEDTIGLAQMAMRVLLLADKRIPAESFDPAGDLAQQLQGLTVLALVGMMDPPRPEARSAIALCHRAGIAVKMITGDNRITAAAIARELGILRETTKEGEVLEGHELMALTEASRESHIARAVVFARTSPEHKLLIVEALKRRGEVVAMTGDGVNDAPALKRADIGVAMGGSGTDVAREAATMILTDDNFATIVHAVEEGRAIYDNIVKFVRFQLATNFGAIWTMLGATLLGLPAPFTAVQLLWINIIMDGPPAMSLGLEPPRAGLMDEPPRRPDTRILSAPRLLRLATYGLTMAAGTLALYAIAAPAGRAYAVSLAFTTFVLFQVFNVFNARAEHGSAFNAQFFRNPWLWTALAAVVLLQALVVHWSPAQALFHTVDLALEDWALAAAVASSVLFLDEARKLALRVAKRAVGSL